MQIRSRTSTRNASAFANTNGWAVLAMRNLRDEINKIGTNPSRIIATGKVLNTMGFRVEEEDFGNWLSVDLAVAHPTLELYAEVETMSLFDYVRVNYPLTDRPKLNERLKALEFQTKSLPTPSLDYFEIKEDGKLWWRKGREGESSEASCRNYFTGLVNMSASIGRHPHGRYEFDILFDEGRVVSVTPIAPPDNPTQ
jgi:hypothetical protein